MDINDKVNTTESTARTSTSTQYSHYYPAA